ncbi:MAG: hypothetical protein CVU02_01660 [Bacteroidetes bacterium HGW-Bacteroidetes-19]|nr:MAG: hypothetical protein CVU04_02900 [Bacteroidetes bacterium HGW-Bacteroidetes-20]PKP28205.1 MAG: hypothetical protein CVU02_01660 [Bacteroidetes bacterium HGW-Bacteroidetes-19]
MKPIFVFLGSLLLLMLFQLASAQIVGYEYWFNYNLNSKETILLTPSNNQIILSDINTDNLDFGMNTLTIRTFDQNNNYSAPIIHPFLKQSNITLSQIDSFSLRYWFDNQINNTTSSSFNGNLFNDNIYAQNISPGIHLLTFQIKHQNTLFSAPINEYVLVKIGSTNDTSSIVTLEYWFDNDINNIHVLQLNGNQNIIFIDSLLTFDINAGLHSINLRFLDQSNQYSSVVSQFFYKIPEQENDTPQIVGFEYWIDQMSDSATLIPIAPSQSLVFTPTINLSTLSMGMHQFHYRFMDHSGLYSAPLTHLFAKSFIAGSDTNNHLIEAVIWLDNDISNQQTFPITSLDSFIIYNQSLDLSSIFKGSHSLTYQFKDVRNIYSTPITDTFVKISFPISSFTYSQSSFCDTATILFTNQSIDGDLFFWDFGDGTADSTEHSIHFYNQPGNYTVSLTVLDTITLQDSTLYQTVSIFPSTFDLIFDTVCYRESYTFPDGTLVTDIENSTIYTSYLFTSNGCNAVYETHLEVFKIDTAVVQNGLQLISHQDNATYQWIRRDLNNEPILGAVNQEFYAVENGIYAVVIYKNNCVDTSSNFTIDNVKIEDHFYLSNFISYPNPTFDIFNVVFDKHFLNIIVTLYSFDGKLITNKGFLNTNKLTINLSSYQNGLYFLKVSTENVSATIPIVKL